ncbi:hypothetical protein K466DRAFT_607110 [Polyporus arcularius HHB13444]|uniref:Uncharacterized protein n=1 Tax=Polyporus arcularius HHB13444 TaxID=1314778 RepID=A0A5C3NM77_9APHY|nr:hypothetical protein K466DRAFT_607110 [Polyporus arcularius HHB13444]
MSLTALRIPASLRWDLHHHDSGTLWTILWLTGALRVLDMRCPVGGLTFGQGLAVGLVGARNTQSDRRTVTAHLDMVLALEGCARVESPL